MTFIPLEIPMIDLVIQSDHFRNAGSRTENNRTLVEPKQSTADEILSTTARELRYLLNQLKTLVGTLLRSGVDWDDATRHEFITRIDREIDQLTATVEARLNVSGETTRHSPADSGQPTLDGQSGVVSISRMLEAALVLGAARGSTIRHFVNGSNDQKWWEAIKSELSAQISGSQLPAANVEPEILAPDRSEELSEREFDVLRLIGIGRSNKQIAQELAITPNTVKTHVSSILGKLGLESRTQAALYMPCLAAWPGKRSPLRPAFSRRVIGEVSAAERFQSGRVRLSAS